MKEKHMKQNSIINLGLYNTKNNFKNPDRTQQSSSGDEKNFYKIKSFNESSVSLQINSNLWLQHFGLKKQGLDKLTVLRNLGFLLKEDYSQSLGKYVKSTYGDNLFVRIKHDETGDIYNVTANKGYIKQLEVLLSQAISLYRSRLEWLTSGSRAIYGVLEQHTVLFVLDVKTRSPNGFTDFINSFKFFVLDQFKCLTKFNVLRCQDEFYQFSLDPVLADSCSLDLLLQWIDTIDRLAPAGPCCTAECLFKIRLTENLYEAIYLITENESSLTASQSLEKTIRTFKTPINILSFECEKMESVEFLKSLTKITGGRFHAYRTNKEIPVYLSNCWDVEKFQPSIKCDYLKCYGSPPKGWGQQEDCMMIFEELEQARSLLERIKQVLNDLERVPKNMTEDLITNNSAQSQFPQISNSCEFGWKNEQHMSSKEWLSKYGLKAQQLDIYDLLASFSFKHCDGVTKVLKPPSSNNEFVNSSFRDKFESNQQQYMKITDKNSHLWNMNAIAQPKLVNAQYCSNFVHIKWKDGSLVHVQITPEIYRLYERRMQSRLNAIRQRLNWLREGSRELFGTITEDDLEKIGRSSQYNSLKRLLINEQNGILIYILIDTSTSMVSNFKFVQQKLLHLIDEQIKYKSQINFISFNTSIKTWQNHLVSTTENNLKCASKWIMSLTCGGTTNTMAALQFALADPLTQGIYLLTDGRPDQAPQTLLLRMHLNKRIPIHTVSFNCADPEANEFLIQLSQDSGGRFHYYNEFPTDPNSPKQWESEDIRLLDKEYQLGIDSLEKLAQLKNECNYLRMKPLTSSSSNQNLFKKSLNEKCINSKFQSFKQNEYRKFQNNDLDHSLNFDDSQNCDLLDNNSDNNVKSLNYSTSNSTYHTNDSNLQPDIIHYPTILNYSKISNKNINASLNKIKIKSNFINDNFNSILKDLCSTQKHNDEDFILFETKQLLNKQNSRLHEALQEEMQLEKKKQEVNKQTINNLANINTVPEWLSCYGLKAQKLSLNEFLAPYSIVLRPTYVPALNRYVISEVLKQTLPLAYVFNNENKKHKKSEIRLLNPLAINFNKYEQKLKIALCKIEKKLIQIIFEYMNDQSLTQLQTDTNLHSYKHWRTKLCWYQDNTQIISAFNKLNWPFPRNEFLLLTQELDLGIKYMKQIIKIREKWNLTDYKKYHRILLKRAPCGHVCRTEEIKNRIYCHNKE